MTTSDLQAEWDKTYGPIFVSAVGLARELKKAEFEQLPAWCTAFIEPWRKKSSSALSTLFALATLSCLPWLSSIFRSRNSEQVFSPQRTLFPT